jgi:ABC-type branched-subunit amino acid transport system ATPase component
VQIALSCSSLHKRINAGVAGCAASVTVLAGLDLEVGVGDAYAVVGAPCAGKSTLLLCAAGLLRVDAGRIAWFGDAARVAAVERARLHLGGPNLLERLARPQRAGALPRLHLLDDPLAGADRALVAALGRWIARRRAAGDAVLVTARAAAPLSSLDVTLRLLAGGRTHTLATAPPRAWGRVAEPTA